MKYCDEYAALLDLYVDGELSAEEMSRVRDHLEACPTCQAYVDDALAIRAAFPDFEDVEVPDGFAGGVMAAIQADAAAQTKTAHEKKRGPWVKTLLPLAACCAIVILLQNGLSGGGKTESDSGAAATTAAFDTAAQSAPEAAEEPEAQAADENWDALEDSFQPSAQMERFTTNNEARIVEDYSAEKKGEADAGISYAMDIPEDENDIAASYQETEKEPAETEAITNAAGVQGTLEDTAEREEPVTGGEAAFSPVTDTYDGPKLRLTAARAGDLLTEYTPVAETETEIRYLLTEEEYQTLLEALPDEIRNSAAVWSLGGAMVIVER